MDWDKLRVFHAVALAKSLTKAGETLSLSQSAVSRQIGGLEEKLGVALFHRHARGLVLTEAGQILQGFVLLNVDAAVDLDNDGAAKKSIVMQWVLDLYDKMIAYLPLPM